MSNLGETSKDISDSNMYGIAAGQQETLEFQARYSPSPQSTSQFAPGSSNDLPPSYVDSTGHVMSGPVAYNGPIPNISYTEHGSAQFTGAATPHEHPHNHMYGGNIQGSQTYGVHHAQQANPPLMHINKSYVGTEELWQLDDAATGSNVHGSDPIQSASTVGQHNDTNEAKLKKREALVREVVGLADPVPGYLPSLECPVILSQRRPGFRERGFVRAYAPVLGQSGINQEAFLKFIENWEKAAEISGWLKFAQFSANVATFDLLGVMLAAASVAAVAAQAEEKRSGRANYNNYLDRVNHELFIPRGLFAMVMKFKPDPKKGSPQIGAPNTMIQSQGFNYQQEAARLSQNPLTSSEKLKRELRIGRGETQEIELPKAAELVFPVDEKAPGMIKKITSPGQSWSNFMDKRVQGKFEKKHPGSALNRSSLTASPNNSTTSFEMPRSGSQSPLRSGSSSPHMSQHGPSPHPTPYSGQQEQYSNPYLQAGHDSRQASFLPIQPVAYGGNQQYFPPPPQPAVYANNQQYAFLPQPTSPANIQGQRLVPTSAPMSRADQQSPTPANNDTMSMLINKGNKGMAIGVKGLKRALMQDVLYLIIVNLPAEHEVNADLSEYGSVVYEEKI